jgi:hypothetical protein
MTVRTISWKNLIENRYHRFFDHSILLTERYPDAHKVELRENVLTTQQRKIMAMGSAAIQHWV